MKRIVLFLIAVLAMQTFVLADNMKTDTDNHSLKISSPDSAKLQMNERRVETLKMKAPPVFLKESFNKSFVLDSLNNNINSMQFKLNNIDLSKNIELHNQMLVRKHEKIEKWKIIGLYSASVIMNGIGDGLNNTHQKTLGHLFNAASIGMLLASPFVVDYNKDKWYWYLLTYTSLRISLFDVAYNMTTKQPVDFIGTTSITDKMYRNLGINFDMSKELSFVVGFSIPLKFL